MNQRKLLEDCWDAAVERCEDVFENSLTYAKKPNKQTYITSILSELKETGCKCQECGGDISVDFIVPVEIWKQICPKPYDGNGSGGLLCGDCIIKKLCLIIESPSPDPQVIWNLAIKTAANACENVKNIYTNGGMYEATKSAEKCFMDVMKYFNDPYHIKVLMGTEPPEDKVPSKIG